MARMGNVSAEIIALKRPDPRIWICPCGCSTFRLIETGEAECAACDRRADGERGGWDTHPSNQTTSVENPFDIVQGNGSVEFAKARAARRAQEPDAALIAVAREDGTVTIWSAAENPKQIKWAKRQLRKLSGLLDT